MPPRALRHARALAVMSLAWSMSPLAMPLAAQRGAAVASAGNGSVVMDRAGLRFASRGETQRLTARIVGSAGKAGAVRWRSGDTAIVTVSSSGVVTARARGLTKVWAIGPSDSAGAVVLVELRLARFSFVPKAFAFDAVGATARLEVEGRDRLGGLLTRENLTDACRSRDEGVVSVTADGRVTARGGGVGYVRCTRDDADDSVRVEVRQRAVNAQIAADGSLAIRFVGDSVRVVMTGEDRFGNAITGAAPQWSTTDPNVVRIDPFSGYAVGVAVGATIVVGNLQGLVDSVPITVRAPAPSAVTVRPRRGTAGSTAVPAGGATFGQVEIPRGRGTVPAGIAIEPDVAPQPSRGGRANEPAVEPAPGRSDPTTARTDPTPARTDPTPARTDPAPRTNTPRPDSSVGAAPPRNTGVIRPPTRRPAMAPRALTPTLSGEAATADGAPRLTDSAAIAQVLAANTVRPPPSRWYTLNGAVAQVDHRVNLGAGVENTNGILAGAELTLMPARELIVRGHYLTGSLDSKSVGVEKRSMAEANLEVSIAALAGTSILVEGVLRGYETSLARQRWTLLRLGAEVRLPFVGGGVEGVVRALVAPVARVSGLSSPGVPISAAAGFEFRSSPFSATAMYALERYTFPEATGVQRMEQLGSFRVGLGLTLGRR